MRAAARIAYRKLMRQAAALQNIGKGSEAAALFVQAEEAAGSELDKGIAAQGEGVAWKIEDDFDRAMAAYHRAIGHYTSAGSELDLGRVYRDMGIICGYQNRPQAQEYLKKSIDLLKPLRSSHSDPKAVDAELGATYANYGTWRLRHGDVAGAQTNIEEALELVRIGKHRFYEMTTLLRLAELRHTQGQHEAALHALDDAEAIITNDLGRDAQTRRLAEIYACRARCQLALDRIEDATQSYQASMDFMRGMSPQAKALIVRQLQLDKTAQELRL